MKYEVRINEQIMKPWAQNLSIDIKTSFETRVLRMVLGSFVDIDVFVMKYYFI